MKRPQIELHRGGVTTFDSRAADHVMKFPRPSPSGSVFAYCTWSKLEAKKACWERD